MAQAKKPEEFDIWTKGPSSPSKLKKRFKTGYDPVKETLKSGKYDPEDLIPDDYDAKKLEEEKKAMSK